MNEIAEQTVRERWFYGRHIIVSDKRYFVLENGDQGMDIDVTIDGWEKFHIPSSPQTHARMAAIMRMLDAWDNQHPGRKIDVACPV